MIQYEKKIIIQTQDVDCENKYSLVGMLNNMQNVVGDHTSEMKVDFGRIIKKYGAFWVITKMKLEIFKHPHWGSEINILTYPLKPSLVRCDRECVFSDEQGDIVAACTSEWCLLDYKTSRPLRVSAIEYPSDAEHRAEQATSARAERLNYKPDDADLCYERVIRYSDLDVNYHTNNISYTRFALDSFSAQKLKEYAVAGYDINFENQSYEGETIKIYRKEIEPNVFMFCGKVDDKCIYTSKLTLTKR